MKAEIKEYCIRCGICVGLYPQLFAHNFEKDCIVLCRGLFHRPEGNLQLLSKLTYTENPKRSVTCPKN